MASINVQRLSRGRSRELCSTGGDTNASNHAGRGLLDAKQKAPGAAGLEVTAAAKRNADDAVKAARERYLNRKKENAVTASGVHHHGRK
jgi:hypothetical protein